MGTRQLFKCNSELQSGNKTTCKSNTNSAYLGISTEKMAWPKLEQLQQPLTPLHCLISCECHANLVSKYPAETKWHPVEFK